MKNGGLIYNYAIVATQDPEVRKMTQIELEDAKDQLMKLIELAASGEEVIISKDKLPFVKLLPAFSQKRHRQFGSAKGLIVMSEDFDEPLADFKEYMS